MEPYLGEIRMFAGKFAPAGWHFCDGTLLPINQNQFLFTLIGTVYGGDGRTTFALPNLNGQVVVGTGSTYTLGQKGGVSEVTVQPSQVPEHTHDFNAVNAPAITGDPEDAAPAITDGSAYDNVVLYGTDPNGTGTMLKMNEAMLKPVGDNKPHDNLMPYMTINYIIAINQAKYPTPQ